MNIFLIKLKISKNSTINKIYLLHNICKNYTLPFANLARMALLLEFLNFFEKLKIINNVEKVFFLETIQPGFI